MGSATKSEQTELSNALIASESCALTQARPQAVQKLLLESDLDGDTKKKLSAKVASCLCSFEPEAAKSLIVSDAAVLFAEPERVQALVGADKGCNLDTSLLAAVASEPLSEATRALLLTAVIEHGSRPARLQALGLLHRKHPLAQQALPSVRKLASEIRNDQELAYQAVLTLARLGDTQFEWPQFVRDTIDMSTSSPSYATALETIRELPSEVVLNEVTPALDSDNPDHVAGACRVGATLGSLAIPIVSKVWNLREKRSPTIKYAAILALLEINPLTPDLHAGLKAILVNRYYAAAYARPIQWRQSVAVVDLDKASFGTLRTVHLERLLLK